MMKKYILSFILFSLAMPTYSITTYEIREPKNPLNQLGIDYEPENKFELIKNDSNIEKNTAKLIQDKTDYSRYTYADLSLKKLAAEVTQDLDMEMADILEDIKILWVGAATRSETISFAMFKLANPDADKPNQTVVKKIIKPVANLTSMAGIGVGDPILATSAMISGNVMNALSSDNKEINYKYSKVTDADMVILVRKIDDLQRILTDKYCDYMSARKILKMSSDITKKRYDRAMSMTNRSKNEILIADAYYREALNYENKKRAEFLSKRSALEQLVGNDALHQFESTLSKRVQ
ncbi:hypothetical protein IJE86_09705 [bacterium]|nr:hypothetical protein [bacterium]